MRTPVEDYRDIRFFRRGTHQERVEIVSWYGYRKRWLEADVYDEVVQGISDEAKRITVGPGLDPSTQMGPLISREQHDKVLGYMSSGVDAGAHASAGGGRSGDRGYFVEPTVLTDTTPDVKVVRGEILRPGGLRDSV